MKYLIVFICLCRLGIAEEFFKNTDSFKRAQVGIYVANAKTGKEVFSSNADQFFVPASLQKVVTSAAAINLLGENFTFKTDFGYQGNIDKEGTLHGNVWVKGGGDPTLSLSIFSKWEEVLKQAGIKKIQGKLLVDPSCFETALASPYWYFEDLGNYYGAGACGLTIHENFYYVTFQPGKKEGEPASVIKIEPEIPHLFVKNEVTTGPAGSGDQVFIFGSEYSPIQFYRGTVPVDQPLFGIKGAIPDPVAFFAETLSKRLKPLKGYEIVKKLEDQSNLLLSHRSASLKDIIYEMNQSSVNLYSENLFKTIGKGTARKGSQEITNYLKNLGIPAEVHDGAGLARTNYLTPRGLVNLLCQVKKNGSYKAVYDSFPILGLEGTVKQLPAISKVVIKAKTGSMSHIYNLAGYILLESGEEYAFCLMCNNYQGSLKEIKNEMVHFFNGLSMQLIQKASQAP